jgi:hypothetical protein
MRCPIDSSVLQKDTYEGSVEVDRCGECGGLWLEQEELEAIQDIRKNDYSDELSEIPNYFEKAYEMALARSEGVFSCPRCHENMEKREYAYCSQIMIDVCPACRGIWLHKDEIAELEIFFEKCRMETAKVRTGFFASLASMFD